MSASDIGSRAEKTFDFSTRIRDGRLGGRQILVIAILGLLVLFDGMDNQTLGLIANDMSHDLGIPLPSFGILFSASMIGSLVGALLLTPLADKRIGRKRLVVVAMGVAGAATVLTAHAGTLQLLIMVRFLAGVGLGAALPSAISLAAEFCPARHSRRVVAAMVAFVPLGSLLASVMARLILGSGSWTTLLYAAGVLTLALSVLGALVLPESVMFLVQVAGNQRRAVTAVTRLFPDARAGAVVVDSDTEEESRTRSRPVTSLFSSGMWRTTALFWLMAIMNQAVLYFVLNWTPALLVRSGLSSSIGIDAAAAFGVGGALGTVAQGWLTTRFNLYKVMFVEIVLFIVSMIALPFVLGWAPSAAPAVVFVVAATVCAYHAGMQLLLLESYPATFRTTAYGWGFGIGRIGATGAPALGGLLLALGWAPGMLFAAVAAPGVVTALALAGLRRRLTRTGSSGDPGGTDGSNRGSRPDGVGQADGTGNRASGAA